MTRPQGKLESLTNSNCSDEFCEVTSPSPLTLLVLSRQVANVDGLFFINFIWVVWKGIWSKFEDQYYVGLLLEFMYMLTVYICTSQTVPIKYI
jgi:hypothetical protein